MLCKTYGKIAYLCIHNNKDKMKKGVTHSTIDTKDRVLTPTQALTVMFQFSNTEIQSRTGTVNYQTVASWRKRFIHGTISTEKARQILTSFGFIEVEDHRFKLK